MISTGLTAIDNWEGNPVFGTDDYTVYQQNVDGTWYFYFLKTAPMTSADADVVLFDTISIPADWDNEEMAEFKGLEIVVEAYGAQAYGFTNCLDAMQANWATDFPM